MKAKLHTIITCFICLFACVQLNAQFTDSYTTIGDGGPSLFEDMPPQPTEYGKCYAKCRIPDCVVKLTTTVLVKEEQVKKVTVPAEYGTVTEQVLVKEASTKIITKPAEYENISEQVLVKEASTKITTKPARYATETERVMTSPAYGKWIKKRKGPTCFSENPDDCYIMCWEEMPAQYKTVSKQVLAEPAREEVIEIPAEYKTVTRRVLKTPAREEVIEIPAEYKTITKTVLQTPARVEETVIPAEYKTIEYDHVADGGKFTRWTEILCAGDMTNSRIRNVQQALSDKGFNPGPIDGVMGGQTKAALQQYQEANKLPIGNLNIETLDALGIN